ncbi:MAG TPA: family 16 glycoside hydrolase [Planctomycetota bacterium]|nr:family 16 glycoside hydrolase [Planctomycetota bacterium]
MRGLVVLSLVMATTWDFEKDEADKAPAGFEFATTAKTPAGNWIVRKEGENKVLVQTDTDKTKSRYALALVKDSSFRDVKLSVRAKPVSGEVDQAAGLVWRCKDADNYYLARSNALESNVRLYRVINGNRTQFAGKEEVKLKKDEWHTLSVEHKGTAIVVFLNDEKLIEAEDKAISDAGKIGLWTKADSVTCFDDLRADELK